MPRIICPYCGTRQNLESNENACNSCSTEIPSKYIQNLRSAEPIWMVTVGYRQHGKTTYLDSLAIVLENLGKISRGTFSTYLDSTTFEKLRDIRVEAQSGQLADSTPPQQKPEPLLISLPRFLGRDTNTLVINDLPGEIFDRAEVEEKYITPILQAETIWFIISIADILNETEGRSIAELVQIYVDNIERLGGRPKGRRVLVIYTKADKVANKLPSEIKDYIGNDPYRNIKQMKMDEAREKQFDEFEYTDKMYRISEELREYTFNEIPRGADMISMIDYYEMDLSFAIVASVPGADGKTTGVDTPRFRVIDPLIWSLTSSSSGNRAESSCALILDGQPGIASMFDQDIPGRFHDALQSNNQMTSTYFLGKAKVETEQRPNKTPRKQGLNTIGPILDRLPRETIAVAIVNQQPLDLQDYMYSSWHDRLLVVCMRDLEFQWSHKVTYDPIENNPDDIVTEFINSLPKN